MDIETKYGTMTFEVVENPGGGFVGQVSHRLHKHPKFSDKVFIRKSRVYKTRRYAARWLRKEYNIQETK